MRPLLLWVIVLLCPVPHLLPSSLTSLWGYSYTKTSSRGVAMIKRLEGFRPMVYRDNGGIKTIGYGHALLPGEHLKQITETQAEILLRQDLEKAEQCLHSLIAYPLTQNQFDALISLIFNIGCPAFKRSHIYLNLKNKAFTEALSYWQKWIHNAKGVTLLGLANRRKQEISLFVS